MQIGTALTASFICTCQLFVTNQLFSSQRYCNSLSRRASHSHYSDQTHGWLAGRQSDHSYQDTATTAHYSTPPTLQANDKTTQTPYRYTPSEEYCDVSAHYSARVKYNQNRELYAPSNRPMAGRHSLYNMEFYPTQGSRRSTVVTPTNARQIQVAAESDRSHNRRSHLNAANSEDEGVVTNCESDSSGSQYATLDPSAIYEEVSQFTTGRSHNARMQHGRTTPYDINLTLDITNPTWDRTYQTANNTMTTDYSKETLGSSTYRKNVSLV